MNHSEIFEAYAKIATAEGLLQDRKETSLEKKLETNKDRKYNSRKDYSQFKHMDDKGKDLYNLKPDQIYKYKDNIAESAHKDSLNLIPSYGDNGIVENVNETHEEMLKKIEKHPHGTYLQFVKAENELLTELVRIADYLDIQNEDKLVSLADGCIEVLNKKASESKKNFKKVAVAPAAAAGLGIGSTVVLVAASVGLVYGIIFAYNNINTDKGALQNITSAKKELQEVLDDQESSNLEQTIRTGIQRLDELKIRLINHYKTTLSDKTFMTEEEFNKYKESTEFKKGLEDLKSLNDLIKLSKQQFSVLISQLKNLDDSKNYYQEEDGVFSKNYWKNRGRDVGKLFNTSGPRDAQLALENVVASLGKFLSAQQEQLKTGEQKAKEQEATSPIESTVDTLKKKFDEITSSGNKSSSPKEESIPDKKPSASSESKTNKPAPDFSWMDKK